VLIPMKGTDGEQSMSGARRAGLPVGSV
jgi:hypothetical protein